jgi:hypothetical protein
MEVATRRISDILNATGEIAANEVGEEAGILATITTMPVDQTLTLGTLQQRRA